MTMCTYHMRTYHISTNTHLLCTNRRIQMYINIDMHTSYRHGDTTHRHLRHTYKNTCIYTSLHVHTHTYITQMQGSTNRHRNTHITYCIINYIINYVLHYYIINYVINYVLHILLMLSKHTCISTHKHVHTTCTNIVKS